MIRLVAFLGNPGKEYRLTRHNLGWLLAEALSFAGTLSWQDKFKAEFASLLLPGIGTSYLLKPKTYMNKSGESVAAALSFFKLSPKEVLVVHDEVELAFGTVHFRLGGGLGGHNGLRSLVQHLGSQEFYRFRLGVGRPPRGAVSSHVLARFTQEEEADLPGYCGAAARILEPLLGTEPREGRAVLIERT